MGYIWLPMMIILLLITAAIFFLNKTWKKRGIIVGVKGTKLVLAVYIGVLIVSVPLAVFLSSQTESYGIERLTYSELEKIEGSLEEALSNGEVEQMLSEQRSDKWTFNYDREELFISFQSDYMSVEVYVERDPELDNEIEAIYFYPRVVVDEMNLSNETNPMDIEISDGRLNIKEPLETELSFAGFEREFPISQFYGESFMGRSSSSSMSQPIIYLRIPEELELETDFDIYLTEVNR
ncbi:hypothetical protein CR194_03745 [Salipaludibacillus keqinensis]|uniref:Uncharacterized protein n=1 Tax=Salipaludibacillus keqinensis TaxID=2045207 RepID=A0A323TQ36_9BACI|nr:hypothetical protein [Salipaludibacillus keqinensis]PYZ94653.1 hypothetical protein CR194_03745 [Salipaludibacillus keqinensis]